MRPLLNQHVCSTAGPSRHLCTRLQSLSSGDIWGRESVQLPALHQRRLCRGAAASSSGHESRGWAGEGDADTAGRLPTQGEAVVRGTGGDDLPGLQIKERPVPPGDIDYLAVSQGQCLFTLGLLAMQRLAIFLCAAQAQR